MNKILLQIPLLLFTLTLFAQNKINFELVRIEGYYVAGFEKSSFYEKNEDKIGKPMWLIFDENILLSDSLKMIIGNSSDGIFLKVTGRKETGGNYGHLGGADSMITVTEISYIDPKNTLIKYFENIKTK
jgi:hypothetical protein